MKCSASYLLANTALCLAAPAWSQAAPGQAGSQTGTRAEAEAEPLAASPGDAGLSQSQSDASIGDDIVVTAQKRAERLTDVPLAVTAIGGDALASRGINDTNTLTAAVPSLTFQQGANPTNTSFRIRGVGTSLFGQGYESSVSTVTDGVVAARQAQGFADLADVERIEVLRGPQGTLFGRNATAGVINIVTARPSRTFGGRVDGTVAEMDEYRVRGTVTGPLNDTMRARLTGYYNNVGGYVRNVVTNRNVNGSEGWGVRGKLEWDATSNLNLLLTGDYRHQNALCCASTVVRAANPIVARLIAPATASFTSRQVSENDETFARSRSYTASLQADWDLGPATVTSITAFQSYKLNVNQPVDRTDSDPIRFVGAGAVYAAWDLNGGRTDIKNITEELRIGSNGGGDLTYVLGLFYSHLNIDRPFYRRRASCVAGVLYQPCATANIRYQSQGSIAHLRTDSIAGFGQLEYRIVGGLKAIGGLRVQYEEGRNTGTQQGPLLAGDALFPNVALGTGSITADDTAVTGKAGLQYEFTRDIQAYGTYSTGYKGLGYQMEAATNFQSQIIVQPETVKAYELGFKLQSSDRKFSLNAALFRSDYRNLQVQANRSDVNTGVVQFVATNAGKSRAQGLELEASLRPSQNFSVNAGFTYADSTVTIAGLNCPLLQQAGAPILTGNFPTNSCYRARTTVNGVTTTSGPIQNLAGAQLPATPKYRVTLSPRFDHELPGTNLAGFVQVNMNFQSDQNFTLEQDPQARQDGYALVDVNIGVRDADDRYNLTLFVRNLFDQNYFTSLSNNTILTTTASPNDLAATFNKDADRYFGATFGVRF